VSRERKPEIRLFQLKKQQMYGKSLCAVSPWKSFIAGDHFGLNWRIFYTIYTYRTD
tara:strand:+ start:1664 stop:1831 length:168 start_codon:yes stop_codon:yes gene_type:complete